MANEKIPVGRPRHQRWMQRALIAAVIILVLYTFMGRFMSWETVSTNFMKVSGSYGPGDFRIQENQVVSMRVSRPKITFKPMTDAQIDNPDFVPEVSEPWMKDISEIKNRTTISFFSGSTTSPSKTFERYAQHADWWLSSDWGTIYLATGWSNFHTPTYGEHYTPQTTKLWKSTDRGQHWQQIPWPEHQNIGFLHFLDPQRGYAIGWGPHVWRTGDGAATWQDISVPAQAKDPEDSRKTFDLVALGRDHVLRMAFVPSGSETGTSEVYALKWGETIPELAFEVPGESVNNLLGDEQGQVYVLSVAGPPYKTAEQITTLWLWDGQVLRKLHTFEKGLVGYAVYLTPSGHLLVQGADYASLLPKDWSALSKDAGQSWRIDKDSSAQGGYYDPVTGTDWRVVGYTLSKRKIP